MAAELLTGIVRCGETSGLRSEGDGVSRAAVIGTACAFCAPVSIAEWEAVAGKAVAGKAVAGKAIAGKAIAD